VIFIKRNNIVGNTYGELTVIKIDEEKTNKSKKKEIFWQCVCSCGNYKVSRGCDLKSGKYTCCNKCSKTRQVANSKTYNEFDVSGDFGVGYIDDIEFYFDVEDYPKIKDIKWNKQNQGYITGYIKNNKYVLLHRFIMDADKDVIIDHINHNKKDNRKSNLRISDYSKNGMNKEIDNRSIYPGVRYHKKYNNWTARIQVCYKPIHLGTFETCEEAISARKDAEDIYCGEFSYRRSVLEKENNNA
jgi:hypothetical protein